MKTLKNLLLAGCCYVAAVVAFDAVAPDSAKAQVDAIPGVGYIIHNPLIVQGNLQVIGRLYLTPSQAGPPTISAGGALDANASDGTGTVTGGTASTGWVLTFRAAWATVPHCTISSPSGSAFTSYAVTLTTLTLVNASATGNVYTYSCR